MARKFKLRFGDGTTLALDEEGLRTWVSRGMVDEKTTVQPPGSKSWLPLQEFLAGEGGKSGRKTSGGPPVADGASLRFREDAEEPPVEEELYDEEPGVGLLSFAWLWLKRLVFTLVLIGALATAAVTWEQWLPHVTQFGLVVFRTLDNKLHPSSAAPSVADERGRAAREALQAATDQLPHLDGPTIERVMATTVVGVIDPPEVFSRSHEAIARGLTSLSREEAEEARALKASLLAALPPADRERLHEYDRMRARRATLPFEDREALALTARAALALPPAQRQRLQALWAKAATAGLQVAGR